MLARKLINPLCRRNGETFLEVPIAMNGPKGGFVPCVGHPKRSLWRPQLLQCWTSTLGWPRLLC